jgi:Ca2+-dependent lipid-binding protein
MSLNEGILSMKVVEGKLYRDTEIMGKMSPYVTLVYQGNKMKTKVADYGGKEPKWTDEFKLDVQSASEEIVMRVWDQDLTTSDAIGFTKIKMSSLIINKGVDDWFTIMFDNKPAGEIRIETTFEPVGGDEYDQMKEEYEAQQERLIQEAEEAKAEAERLRAEQEEIKAKLAETQE